MVAGIIVAGFMLDGDRDRDPDSNTDVERDVVSDADISSEANDVISVYCLVGSSVPGVTLVAWESVPLSVRVRRTHVAFALLYDVPAPHSVHMGLGNDSSGQRRKATALPITLAVPRMMCWPMATASRK